MTIRSGRIFHDRLRAAVLPLTLAALLGVAGCAHAQSGGQMSQSDLPAGAIATGDGVYMVPIAPDEAGCMQYRMHAPGKAVVQMIFYRSADGKFTPDRAQADCKKP
jgi:hypothetical protein